MLNPELQGRLFHKRSRSLAVPESRFHPQDPRSGRAQLACHAVQRHEVGDGLLVVSYRDALSGKPPAMSALPKELGKRFFGPDAQANPNPDQRAHGTDAEWRAKLDPSSPLHGVEGRALRANESLGADVYVPFAFVPHQGCGRKRARMAAEASLDVLRRALAAVSASGSGSGCSVFAPIVCAPGTQSRNDDEALDDQLSGIALVLQERDRETAGVDSDGQSGSSSSSSTNSTGSGSVAGFWLDPGCAVADDATLLRSVQTALSSKIAVESLPSNVPRFVAAGGAGPRAILELFNLGCDAVESTYALEAAENNYALQLAPALRGVPADEGVGARPEPPLLLCSEEKGLVNRLLCDESPVEADCTCFTCTHHTRAYVFHLLRCNDLLGRSLLFLHNAHAMLRLGDCARAQIQAGEFERGMLRLWREGTDARTEHPWRPRPGSSGAA